jgi:hypothetical protein
MKRLLVAVSASLLLTLALVAPVGAAGPGCSDFGAASATGGHKAIPGLEGVPFGQVLSLFVHTGPGAISAIVAGEHSTMCAQP